MPVMTKMRDSMPVVFAVLAGIFLLMIIFQWGGQGMIFESHGEKGVLGTVNGFPITQETYNKILSTVTEEMKQKNKVPNLSDADEQDAEDKAWDEAVSQAIIDQSIDKLDLSVTDQEVRDLLFNNPPADVKKTFTDSLGQFHQDAYIKALRDPRNDSLVRLMEADVRQQVRNMKWQQTLASTCRVTDSEAFIRYQTDSSKAIVEVIKFPAAPVDAQKTTVSDKDIQDYYNSHSWMYQQEEQRKFQFVRFLLVPNARDTAQAMETANNIKSKLAEASMDDLDTVAREIASDYSDAPPVTNHMITVRELGTDTSMLSLKAGDVGVASVSGKITALRVMRTSDSLPTTLYHLRHIVFQLPGFPSQQTKDSTVAAATQVLNQLKAGANFGEMARQHSSDPRSSSHGGDMGWTDTGFFPPMLRSSISSAPIGAIVGPVEGPNGYEIFQVLGASRRQWFITGIPLVVKPSHQTLELEQQNANIFREAAQKNGFEQTAKSDGYHLISDIPAASKKGSPIFSSHKFVDWVFQASEGDVSQPFTFDRMHFILVAQMTHIIPAGPKPLDAVKQDIAQTLEFKKEVAALAPRAQQIRAMIGDTGSMMIPVSTTGDSSLKPLTVLMGPAESVNGLPTAEYAINHWVYSGQPGTVSPPIKGERGYYIAKIMGRTVPTYQDFQSARTVIMKQILQEREQRLLTDWVNNQKDHAKIEDFRLSNR